jgi:beta-lactamase superfamily II metal-dependent hydrolase
MSRIKSFAVGYGDMFYINHNSDNFTIIDCFLGEDNFDEILDEVKKLSGAKGITRFISSHPDNDHVRGLVMLDDKIDIRNFYCVKNKVIKEDQTEDFDRYYELRDSDKAYYIYKNCKRKWMNQGDEERGNSGVHILWPDVNNANFKDALADAEAGGSPNNMSAVVRYSLENGVKVVWFGDLHKDFMEKIEDELDCSHVDIVFAPHHGRRTGRIPNSILKKMSPSIVVIGEAATEHLDYYAGYNTITQNSAGDIIFECVEGKVHIFTSNDYDAEYLDDENMSLSGYFYAGTLQV